MKIFYKLFKFKNRIVLDILSRLYKEKTIKQAKINGYKIMVDLQDSTGKQVYGLKRYEKKNTDVLKKAVKGDWVCVDVGANIGYYSLLLAKLAPAGKVHAIEPNEELCQMIKTSSELNGYKIDIIAKPVGSEKGLKTFFISNDSGFSSLQNIDNVKKEVQVEVARLDDLFTKVDFIKIDTEGTAKEVVKGMTGILKNARPKLIQIEIDLDEEVLNIFKSFNYSGYYIKRTGVFGKIEGNYPKNVDYYFVSQEYEKDFFASGFIKSV